MSFEKEKFTFKYEGDLEYIDFDTLYVSQLHFTEFIKEVKDSLYPDGELKIKVKALPPGSFPIELSLDLVETTKNLVLVGATTLLAAGGLFSAVNSIIDFYKNLRGAKPDKEEDRGDKTIIYIDNRTFEINTSIYEAVKSNPKIRKELSATFEKIERDDEVTGVELLDNQGTTAAKINRSDFESYKPENIESIIEQTEETVRKKLIKNSPLRVFKVVFEKGFKWEFIYQGNRIRASVIDENFLLSVMQGERSFTNGDMMVCDLRIDQKLNVFANAFENISYTVIKVTEYLPRDEQTTFDFD